MHVGMLISFTLNTFVNFKKANKLFMRFLCFYSIILVGIGISTIILKFGTALAPVTYVKIFSMVFVAAIQFVLNKFITFKF